MRHAPAPPDRPLLRLLVGSDFSPGAAAALSRLPHLPLAPRAEIMILHALPAQLRPALRAREVAEAKRRLRWEATRLVRRLRAAGKKEVRVRTTVTRGHAPQEILRRSALMDLVVVGRHGRRPFRDLLVGSTAQRVVQHRDVAILLVARRALSAYRRPLVAVDLSDTSQATLDLAVRVVAPNRPLLHVVHVYEAAYEGMLAGVAKKAARAAYQRECRDEARAAVTKLIEASAAASVVRTVALRHADPRRAILGEARARRADLIALGTHGRTGLPHLLLGSVAEAVMHHATCDVLVTPPRRSSRRRSLPAT